MSEVIKRHFKVKNIILLLVISVILVFFLFRAFSHREIDDVTPGISCEEEYLKKSDILWVIPEFSGNPISENREWCSWILGMNKTLGLHGVYHTYNEFGEYRNESYVAFGEEEFEKCFGFEPESFKAPQLNLSDENALDIQERGLSVKGKWNQLFHKVYHCNDTGRFSNRFLDWF